MNHRETIGPARLRAACVITFLALAGARGGLAQTYEVVRLGTLGAPGSWARGMNDRGDVVGNAFLPPIPIPGSGIMVSHTHAYLASAKGMIDLGTLPGGTTSFAYDINDARQIVGTSSAGLGPRSAFVWEHGAMSALEAPPGYESFAFGINDSGTIVGHLTPEDGLIDTDSMAVRWDDGKLELLPAAADWQSSIAGDVNGQGQIVGWRRTASPGPQRAVIWDGPDVTVLGTINGASFSAARAINEVGQVVGHSGVEYYPGLWTRRAFLWEGGAMVDLGTLGGWRSEALDINGHGRIVGAASTGTDYEHAFLWSNGHMVDLNDLIPEGSGWELLQARAIDASGRIAGHGRYHGTIEAFLLLPSATCGADLTGNGLVDGADVSALMGAWGDCAASDCQADLDGNGRVDVEDLIELILAWGTCA